jgi:hypothetical protein
MVDNHTTGSTSRQQMVDNHTTGSTSRSLLHIPEVWRLSFKKTSKFWFGFHFFSNTVYEKNDAQAGVGLRGHDGARVGQGRVLAHALGPHFLCVGSGCVWRCFMTASW